MGIYSSLARENVVLGKMGRIIKAVDQIRSNIGIGAGRVTRF